jgi:O-antigen/teichoic acid export membrane protein
VGTTSDDTARSSRVLTSAGLLVGAFVVLTAAWLGSREFRGTFGSTAQEESCGSVWGLPWTGSLNALSCTNDLRDRVAVVAILLGVGAIMLSVTLLKYRRSHGRTGTSPWVARAIAVTIPVLGVLLMIAFGRDLIWSVRGA